MANQHVPCKSAYGIVWLPDRCEVQFVIEPYYSDTHSKRLKDKMY